MLVIEGIILLAIGFYRWLWTGKFDFEDKDEKGK